MEDIFLAIYQGNVWGSPESRSGPGSTLARAADFLPDLTALMQTLGIRTLVDAPCGDFNWASALAAAVDRYTGIDVVREIVARNRRLAGSPNAVFLHGDLTRDPLPPADAILCRDCLVHFSLSDAWRALRNFKQSHSRYLLATTFVDRDGNPDITTGEWRPVNLERPPFSFPPPLALVDERCLHTGGAYRDKRIGLWELSDLCLE